MKKIIPIIMIIALFITGLAGCSSTPNVTSTISQTGTSSIESLSSNSYSTSKAISSEATTASSAVNSMDSSSTKSINATSTSTNTKSTALTNIIVPQGTTYQPAPSSLAGTVSFSGSTSVYPVIAALTEAFKLQYPKVKIQITNVTGSGAGLADAKSGTVSFGMRSSAWKTTDGDNINNVQIAMDGVAMVVHPSNSLTDITMADIASIYLNTDKLGINAPVNRENGSGTRTCFTDISGVKTPRGVQLSSTEAVASEVAVNTGAIGYMSLGSVGSNVKKLSVDGIEANDANVVNGTYKMSRPFLLLRRNDRPYSATEKEFLKFILSSNGQKIINNSNFIPLSSSQITAELAKVNK